MSGALRENLAQLGAGLVQLRLGGADGAAEYLRDLLVLVAFDIVEDEGGAVAGRQLLQGLVERHAVDQRRPLHPARRDAGRERMRRGVLQRLLPARPAPAETHQDLVDREAMKPRGELRLAAETSDLAVQQDEDVL